ncbi:predicted protein [Scheffersomyces stipitis CBS 6054]|uniref:Major facilitator superfamily (MFS) profile domain-containing protein n=1 Tax=Scheffersomyces stipitis (strain ATCC 58785 / CBS 6054 / NBRC 10063 / NRRL Y-11545) TaxID=322104 RepID=A3LT06_PICST|nr:predicted protein [Scheffersomyces stipitis CBS 6054]ABN66326.1 predicted protein [Scheffersomyces stipitis CBS 6054]KAG2732954.1 hypothetical protein G9P44_003944 [Scheffersomyces stipitis]
MTITKLDKAHVAITMKAMNVGDNTSHRPGFENRNSDEDINEYDGRHSSNVEPIPEQEGTIPKYMTINNPPRNKWRYLSCIFLGLCVGFNDAAPGALLPHMEVYYGISYSVASLIWVASATGFIVVACLAHKIQPWMGKRYSLTLGCALGVLNYLIVGTGTKYPAIVASFFFGGAGSALQIAQTNIFVSRLDKASTYLSFLHGAYGIGATISPLLATSIVARGVTWHYYYFVLMGIMFPNMIAIFYAFKNSDEDLKPWDEDPKDLAVSYTADERLRGEDVIEMTDINATQEYPQSHQNLMLLALKTPTTWLICFFVLFYQGAEVAMGGWIVSFFLDYRHGNPKYVGYTASGYWGGLTIGRLCLTKPLHKTLGARRSVLVVSCGAMILVALVWAVPNLIAEAVLVAFAGMMTGPNYPLLVVYTGHDGLIPRKIQVITLTIMSAFGSSGGAIFPFIVGLISQTTGTFVVLPIFIILYCLVIVMWACLPNLERRNSTPSKSSILRLWERIW